METSTSNRKGRVYAVAFDSTLGLQIQNYIKRCTMCNNAIRDFLQSLEQKYSFPVRITDDTSYHLSDDCDAGGLMAISVSKSDFMASDPDVRSRVLWDWMQVPDDEDSLYLFPRIEPHTRYIKYGKAVRCFEKNMPEWDFEPATPRELSKGMKLHAVHYGDVARRISNDDLAALVSKPGTTPSQSMRLAIGRQYVLNQDTLADYPEFVASMGDYFVDAVALYKEWTGLPVVAANSLARTLGLKSERKAFADLCFCEWRIDADHKRYLIHTGLDSSRHEMVEVTDRSALSIFDQ